MESRKYIPFELEERVKGEIVTRDEVRALPKLFKPMGLAVGYTGGSYAYGQNRVNFEPSPYDFDRIIQAIDTDSYIKQGFNKYKELFWKEGWTIVGEDPDAIAYLRLRLSFMEFSMNEPMSQLLTTISDQLVKFGNSFVVKVRGNLNEFFPCEISGVNASMPIIGYEVLPAETVEIMRDYRNNPLKYRQNIWGAHGYNAPSGFGRGNLEDEKLLPEWSPSEIIHFVVDQKPGRLFGTPFVISVMDDILALRTIEQDVQNLVHRELFPVYLYKIGNEQNPAEPDEIEEASAELAGLRTEGGLILTERHEVSVLGAEGKSLDANPYLEHFKERVAAGMGMHKKHMNMQTEVGGEVGIQYDTALFDKIKLYQRYYADVIQFRIFNELLLEADFDPLTPNTKQSGRCHFVFNEIDVDTQVKKENHIIQKWVSNVQTLPETRLEMNRDPDYDKKQLFQSIMDELSGGAIPQRTTGTGASSGGSPPTSNKNSTSKPTALTRGGGNNAPKNPASQAPSTGGRPNLPAGQLKGILNRSQPTNQYGRSPSPGIGHHSDDLDLIVELLKEESEEFD